MIETISQDDFVKLLTRLSIPKTLLDDIVECFLHRPDGIAHIEDVVAWLSRHTKRDLTDAPKETITRRINDYCRNANDAGGRRGRLSLFDRIAPVTWRLVSYPKRPNLFDIPPSAIGDYGMKRGLELLEMQRPEIRSWPATDKYRLLINAYETREEFRQFVDSSNAAVNSLRL